MAVNYLAQTGALEDLIWSIMNDAETEAHADRLVSSFKRDLKYEEDDQARDVIETELYHLENLKECVREARYQKTKLACSLAAKVADNEQLDKYSCMFKHQLLSMAEMRDTAAAIQDEQSKAYAMEIYEKTASNAAMVIAKFLGLEIESCIACLFEKNRIEER